MKTPKGRFRTKKTQLISSPDTVRPHLGSSNDNSRIPPTPNWPSNSALKTDVPPQSQLLCVCVCVCVFVSLSHPHTQRDTSSMIFTPVQRFTGVLNFAYHWWKRFGYQHQVCILCWECWELMMKKRKEKPQVLSTTKGESSLVSSPPSTEQLALVCIVYFLSSFPPLPSPSLPTRQEAITTLQNNLGWNGAPIPTYNPLYIIYNFQQEVLFFAQLRCQAQVPGANTPPPILVTKVAVCVHRANPLIHVTISFAKSGNWPLSMSLCSCMCVVCIYVTWRNIIYPSTRVVASTHCPSNN